MRTAIRKRLKDVVAIVILVLLAVAVGGYILHNERLRFPFIQPSQFKINATFSTAQAVTPGQGQTVNVSGVPIGEISSVKLVDGQAVVGMSIDPKYKSLIHTDASALIRPRTGLQDVFVELDPGSNLAPAAKPNWTIPLSQTEPEINLDQVEAELDSDTRGYLKLLIQGGGQGLKGRGGDLREVFARFEPTDRDLARVSRAVAGRQRDLRQLVHALRQVNDSLAAKHVQLTSLVGASSQVFRAFASENQSISRALQLFPPALRTTTDTLRKVTPFANELSVASERLRPAARALTRANLAVRPAARTLTPIIRDQIRPFVVSARPLVRDLRPASVQLARATPDLRGSFAVLNHLFNMLGFDPNPHQRAPYDGTNETEGFLFWIAWVTHLGVNTQSIADANGPLRPVTLGVPCDSVNALLGQLAQKQPAVLGNLLGNQNLTFALSKLCTTATGGGP